MTVKGDCPGYWILAVEPAGEIIHVSGLAVNISESVRELKDGSRGKDGAWQTSMHYYIEDINCQMFNLTVWMFVLLSTLCLMLQLCCITYPFRGKESIYLPI